jgi:hemolysin III
VTQSGQAFFDFPEYTRAERLADGVVHWLGVGSAVGFSTWLVTQAAAAAGFAVFASLLVYCLGLVGALGASAAYNLTRAGRAKELLRRIDHAMIFVLIAASYTPYAAISLGGEGGLLLLLSIWSVAAFGVALKLLYPRRLERLSVALYLGMGWMAIVTVRPLVAAISEPTLWLLAAGGVLYSLGAAVHHLRRLPFHNVIWHAMVLVAAGLHFTAACIEFVL